jgi:predicted metal-dependent phosphoesterase TrpH
LAELHAHTTWSDGAFSVGQVVDIYGSRGFDILCITDHVVRSDDPWLDPDEWCDRGVRDEVHSAYLAEVEREAARAQRQYELLVLPGLELTYNDLDPLRAAHAVAVGLESFVSVDDGIAQAMQHARTDGAAIIAAHPFDDDPTGNPERFTRAFATDAALCELADRFELFNRTTLFGWVSREGLPAVATGDFHRLDHLSGWKTLLPCARTADAVVAYLRSQSPAYLAHVGAARPLLAA